LKKRKSKTKLQTPRSCSLQKSSHNLKDKGRGNSKQLRRQNGAREKGKAKDASYFQSAKDHSNWKGKGKSKRKSYRNAAVS